MALATNPGIFWVNSGVTMPDVLSYPAFVTWYENIHAPDWIAAKPGAIPAAWRYEAVDKDRKLPFLVVYRYNDIADFNSPEYMKVPITHPSLPEGGPITKFADIEAMLGPTIDVWKSAGVTADHGALVVSEGINPARNISDQVFNNWYRTTYINEVSQIKGWRRTSRFENTMRSTVNPKTMPHWLALHEFDSDAFDGATKLSSLLGESKETRDIQRAASQIDIALFTVAREYGNKTTSWGTSENEVG